jgi:type II secretion system protein G
MGLRPRKESGFTLIELLVVIVIICLIAALLLPAILKALCSARAGTAAHLISQLDQAAEAYQLDYAVYPTGSGTGTKDLVYALSQSGPKKQKYFEFPVDLLTTGGDVVNPVWSDGDPAIAMIYYRLNVKQGGAPPGGGGGNQPPPQRKSKFDMWCAGCDYTTADPKTNWSINNF